jgi:hypothetical protein
MKKNMGKIDKIFRITIGTVAIAIGIYFQSWWGTIGIIPLLTSFIGWCPAYAPFGISTIFKNNKSQGSIK